MTDRLAIVIPAYNEEESLNNTVKVLSKILIELEHQQKISNNSFLLFIDDGSTDNTWKMISEISKKSSLIQGIKLTRNFGHQYALWAGLMEISKDKIYKDVNITISIDADLQDDPNAIFKMIDEFKKGNQIVYGVRNDRSTDSFFKRTTAHWFYKIMKLLGANIIPNHADFRLMSRKALILLSQYHERQLFLRGLVPKLGLKTSKVFYKRRKRIYGKSKYTLRKMFNLAWDGIILFSDVLLKVPTILGALSLVCGLILLIMHIFHISLVSDVLFSLWIIGGFILISLGIMSEYLGKVFNEVKDRPRYLIEEKTTHDVKS